MRDELLSRVLSLLPTGGDRPELRAYADMLRDYPTRGGKGIRSELLLASARVHGAQPGTPAYEGALWLAAALELFQNWVLIHDDIEDDSEERRGRPALHRLHGVPLAINAGDALHVSMWEAVLRAGVPGAMEEFLFMIHRTAEGQHLDLSWVEHGEWTLHAADYVQMVELKTAHYTVISPLRLGALAAGTAPEMAFTEAGLALGTAFQIRDDVLNLAGDPAQYGKEIGGDLLEGKRTMIVLRWLEDAPEEQRRVFLEQMRRDRPAKDAAVIAEIRTWLLDSGSVADAQDYAHAQAARGLTLLETAFQDAADPQAARELLAVLRDLATRDA
ncbi:geranylgeranyl diphosphate synthase type II [Deinococcus metalli]|uniref:Geranylgeranyl diphosphate synthase type II n=1 Tax=Deinococcus metalli TaxID=1141878 RepID=A0A7W8KAV5_9DEIO|nr:polyprenyl synthetase family protein [Deinococcus metalli]MBB5374696.1 geranylgeranyl diphosphate synthase type II [Deinococcus metalli]GHF34378.1 geranylgeranyl diphosphate synthetase [Deinococcus metalli]